MHRNEYGPRLVARSNALCSAGRGRPNVAANSYRISAGTPRSYQR